MCGGGSSDSHSGAYPETFKCFSECGRARGEYLLKMTNAAAIHCPLVCCCWSRCTVEQPVYKQVYLVPVDGTLRSDGPLYEERGTVQQEVPEVDKELMIKGKEEGGDDDDDDEKICFQFFRQWVSRGMEGRRMKQLTGETELNVIYLLAER